jgi:hypothetical protein
MTRTTGIARMTSHIFAVLLSAIAYSRQSSKT